MIGETFGQLTARELACGRFSGSNFIRYWTCDCTCGRSRIVAEPELKRLRVTHCDRRRGVPRGREYTSYSAMKARCYQVGNKEYRNYGGRGIVVCDRWISGFGCDTGFECFLEDMGPIPGPGYSIEREDSDGNYTPDNCCWATNLQQARNKRRSIRVSYQGKMMPLKEAAEKIGIPYQTLRDRLFRYGMSPERAMQPIVQAGRDR